VGFTGSQGTTGFTGSLGGTGYTGSSGATVGYTAGDNSVGYVLYNGTTGSVAGKWNGAAVNPTQTTRLNYEGYLYATRVYGAVFNDYAEYRPAKENYEAGTVVVECGDGSVTRATKRLQKASKVVSDTYGMGLGEPKDAVAVSVAGRVLVRVVNRGDFNIGDAVCAGKDGFACKMNWAEVILYSDRILGIVSEIPTYRTWGTLKIPVNNRIWISI
jgi:hypothetical protein